MDIPEFPVQCLFVIEDAKNADDAQTGAGFTMVSTEGVASTYALQGTVAASSATKTGSNASATTDADSTTGLGSGTTLPSGAQGASTATGSNSSETGVAASSDSSLSPGAKAGLAIGIILAVIAVLAGVFFFFRRSKRQMQMQRLNSTAGVSPREKAGVTGPTAVASGARTSEAQDTGPETLATPTFHSQFNNRNSEDWRRFFGSAGGAREGGSS